MSSHHLDQAARRADGVSAYCQARYGKNPAKLDRAQLDHARKCVDGIMAVFDVWRLYDIRARAHGGAATEPSLEEVAAVMAGEAA